MNLWLEWFGRRWWVKGFGVLRLRNLQMRKLLRSG